MDTQTKVIRLEHFQANTKQRVDANTVTVFTAFILCIVAARLAFPQHVDNVTLVVALAAVCLHTFYFHASQNKKRAQHRFCAELQQRPKAYLVDYSQSPEVSEVEKRLALDVLNRNYPGWSFEHS